MRNKIRMTAAAACLTAVGAVCVPATSATAATPAGLQVWYASSYKGCTTVLTKSIPDLRKVHFTSGGALCKNYPVDNETISARLTSYNCVVKIYTGYNYAGAYETFNSTFSEAPVVLDPNEYSSVKVVCL